MKRTIPEDIAFELQEKIILLFEGIDPMQAFIVLHDVQELLIDDLRMSSLAVPKVGEDE